MSGSSNLAISYAKNHTVTEWSEIAMLPIKYSNILKNIPGKWCILVSKLLEAVGSKTSFPYHSLLLWRSNYTKVSLTPPFPTIHALNKPIKPRGEKIDTGYIKKCLCNIFICSPGRIYPFYDASAGNLLDPGFSASIFHRGAHHIFRCPAPWSNPTPFLAPRGS